MKDAQVLFIGGCMDRRLSTTCYDAVPFEIRIPDSSVGTGSSGKLAVRAEWVDLYKVNYFHSEGKTYLVASTDDRFLNGDVHTLIKQFKLKEVQV